MSYSEAVDKLQMKPEFLRDFKRDLLVTVFNQTRAQLLLYQQGMCLKTAKAYKGRKIPLVAATTGSSETMPSAEVLEDLKIHKELDALKSIYSVAYETLARGSLDSKNPYAEVIQTIEAQNESSCELDLVINELTENKSRLEHLKELEIKTQSEITEKFSQTSQRVKLLREQLNNTKRINRLELRLVEKWENNRLTQAIIMGEKKERLLMEQILDLHRRMSREQRLSYEIESFRTKEISELKIKIADWEKKFKEEKSKIETENSILTKNIAEIVNAYEKRREITEQRTMYVAEFLRKKAEERHLYEQQCHRIECSIRIQAWWRGIMVRKGLGPYRKKLKKSKKAKGKN